MASEDKERLRFGDKELRLRVPVITCTVCLIITYAFLALLYAYDMFGISERLSELLFGVTLFWGCLAAAFWIADVRQRKRDRRPSLGVRDNEEK